MDTQELLETLDKHDGGRHGRAARDWDAAMSKGQQSEPPAPVAGEAQPQNDPPAAAFAAPRVERPIECLLRALREHPEGLGARDLATVADVPQKQIPGTLAARIKRGDVVVRKGATGHFYRLAVSVKTVAVPGRREGQPAAAADDLSALLDRGPGKSLLVSGPLLADPQAQARRLRQLAGGWFRSRDLAPIHDWLIRLADEFDEAAA